MYCCPDCTIKKRKKEIMTSRKPHVSKGPTASDLPRTKLSERLERHVRSKVEEKCMKMAKDKSVSEVGLLLCIFLCDYFVWVYFV